MDEPEFNYGGFWLRFGAMWLDALICAPLAVIVFVGQKYWRLFDTFFFVPNLAFGFFYSVYLVQRYGGTPGKVILGLRVRRVDGSPIGFREAVLRELPLYALNSIFMVATIIGTLRMTDEQYLAFDLMSREQGIEQYAPTWRFWVTVAMQIWIWSEFVVLLTNKRRRAIHDFIAGTIVIKVGNQTPPVLAEPKPV